MLNENTQATESITGLKGQTTDDSLALVLLVASRYSLRCRSGRSSSAARSLCSQGFGGCSSRIRSLASN